MVAFEYFLYIGKLLLLYYPGLKMFKKSAFILSILIFSHGSFAEAANPVAVPNADGLQGLMRSESAIKIGAAVMVLLSVKTAAESVITMLTSKSSEEVKLAVEKAVTTTVSACVSMIAAAHVLAAVHQRMRLRRQ